MQQLVPIVALLIAAPLAAQDQHEPPGVEVAGVVVDAGGEPAAGAQVAQ